MRDKGQFRRADRLEDTFREINNDDDAEYKLRNDSLTLKGDKRKYAPNSYIQGVSRYSRNHQNGDVKHAGSLDVDVDTYPDGTETNKAYIDRKDPLTAQRITKSPKKARNMERHMKNFHPQTKMTKEI